MVAHELRRFDIATFRVATAEPLHVPARASPSAWSPTERPRIWRFYSMANAPRDDQTMDFHVRMIDGGALSMVLTRGLAVGARLRLGPPVGTLTYEPGPAATCCSSPGAPGLAPLKAIVEQISGAARPAAGAPVLRRPDRRRPLRPHRPGEDGGGLPWLTVIPVVSDEPGYPGERGTLHERGGTERRLAGARRLRVRAYPDGRGDRHSAHGPGRPAGARSTSKTSAGVSHDRVLAQRRAADTRPGAVDQFPPGTVRPPRPRRGDTCSAFRDHVEHELMTLLNEKASLWEEVERLRRRILDSGESSGARPEDAHVQAVRILSNAQQMADKLRGRCAGVQPSAHRGRPAPPG